MLGEHCRDLLTQVCGGTAWRGRRRVFAMALAKQPAVFVEHRIPLARVVCKHHHVEAGGIEGRALALIQLLLQRLLVVRTVHKHQRGRFHVGEVRHHVVIGHRRLGLIRQQIAPLLQGLQPEPLQPALAHLQQLIQPLAAPRGASLGHHIGAGQIEQELLQGGEAPIDQLVVALVVVAEQAAIAAGFAVLVGVVEVDRLLGQ